MMALSHAVDRECLKAGYTTLIYATVNKFIMLAFPTKVRPQPAPSALPEYDPLLGEQPLFPAKSAPDRFIKEGLPASPHIGAENQSPCSDNSTRLNKLYVKYVLNDCDLNQLCSEELGAKPRQICKTPYKVLDAPALQDDFYLNLIDWSNDNVLAVGLGNSVYLWSPSGGRVNKLCDNLSSIASVGWSRNSQYLGVGTHNGETQIWDAKKLAKVRTLQGHQERTSVIAWANSTLFSTGSRDNLILQRDLRSREHFIDRLVGHKQEVCGLKWSEDEQQLCSGGNDNKLFIWSNRSSSHIYKFSEHTAAVKALAWSPHQHGVLASGGGTADRTIRFWNTTQGRLLKTVDTGSQVCNLVFSKNSKQLISTHGYSQNEICIWDKDMARTATLTGHSYRVLYLAMNPEGTDIVTGAGDQTLRFWKLFDRKQMGGRSRPLGACGLTLR